METTSNQDSLNQKVKDLRRSEEQLSLIYDTIADVLFYLKVEPDDCFRFLSINEAFLTATGLTTDQIVGKSIEEVIPEPSIQLVLDNYKKAIKENRVVRWEETSVYPAGEKAGAVSIVPITNEKGICTHLVGSVHDITEHRQAKAKILSERNKLLTAIDGSVDIIGITDLEGNIRTINKSFTRITGFESKEIIGKKLTKVQPKKDVPKALNAFKEVVEKGVCSTFELDFLSKDGRTINTLASGVLLKDEKGKPSEAILMAKDITERKQAEKTLKESELRFRSVVENANEAIVVAQDKTVKYSNQRTTVLTGYTSEEMDSRDFVEFIHPEDRETVMREYRDRLSRDRPAATYSIRIVTKDGSEKYVLISSAMINWDGRPATLAMLTDITERKLMEEKLQLSENRLSLIFESLADILFYIKVEPDDCFRFLSVNPSFLKATGLTQEQIIGKRIEEIIPEPSVQLVLDNYKKSIKENSIVRWEETSVYPTGKKIGAVSIAPVLNENGICTHLVGSVHDITELKQAELEAQEQRDVFARVDRASRMGQLTGSIAHELNQPLTGILSNAQAAELMLKSKKWKPEDYEGIIADIIVDTKRAGEVIRNLRELYREHKGEYTAVEINSVAEEAIQLLHSDFVMRQVELTSELVPSIPLVNGNKSQLQQVLVNLIMNGEQAMSSIERDNRKLHISTAFDDREVKVLVDDFGPGIDADKIDRIFEPLVTWKAGGTGMGLAIGSSIISAHGGRMWAENRPEGGARVGFALPVMKKERKK